MKLIAVSQRVDVIEAYAERRDAIDQKWHDFLRKADLQVMLVPNNHKIALELINSFTIQGILLTGGNTLVKYGGDAQERDETEAELLSYAIKKRIPLMGVCRGMQFIQDFFKVSLQSIDGHIAKKQDIIFKGERVTVNSFHTLGTYTSVPDLVPLGKSSDGVIKAIKHKNNKIFGIMWHPERICPFRDEDINLFRDFYNI